jgi:putative PIN family toxin of toxin-antitoxin system
LSPKPPKRRRRGVVDTSVLVAGIAGFKGEDVAAKNPSAILLRAWIDDDTFTWLVSEAVLDEYVEVLRRCRVRRSVIGTVVNLLREEAELVVPRHSIEAQPDPDDAPFWECAEVGDADFIVTLNKRDFPQSRLRARVVEPGEPLPSLHPRDRLRRRRGRGR